MNVRQQVGAAGRALRRRTGTGVPLVVRLAHLACAVGVSALLAGTHGPGAQLWGFTVVVAVGALMTVLDAEGAWSTGTLGVIVAQYLLGTLSRSSAPPGTAVLYGIVAGLYLTHATAALAAGLPAAARADRSVLFRWLSRTAVVLVATLPFVLGSALVQRSDGDRLWPLVGIAAAASLAVLPALAFRARAGEDRNARSG